MPENMCQVSSHSKRSFWEHHLERWQQSGLSQRAYCRKHQLKPHQFYYWRRRIRKPQTQVSFLPVTLPADTPQQSHLVRILMPNGCAMELEGRAESEQLERLVNIVAAL
jgi:transposase-like protein